MVFADAINSRAPDGWLVLASVDADDGLVLPDEVVDSAADDWGVLDTGASDTEWLDPVAGGLEELTARIPATEATTISNPTSAAQLADAAVFRPTMRLTFEGI